MNTNTKRLLGTGTALAALFVGATLHAAPASAMTPGALLSGETAPLFAQHSDSDRSRGTDDYGQGRYVHTSHDNGSHYGWAKAHGRRVRHADQSRYGAHYHMNYNPGGQYPHRDDNATQPGSGYHRGGDDNAQPGDYPHHPHDTNGDRTDGNGVGQNQRHHDQGDNH